MIRIEIQWTLRVYWPSATGSAPAGICNSTSTFFFDEVGLVTTIWQP